MVVYNYDPKTKEFTGSQVTREDPLESKIQNRPVYILPANSTFVECPVKVDGYAWCFDETRSRWYKVVDNRWKKVYSTADGSEGRVADLGAIPMGYTEKKPEGNFPKWNGDAWEEDVLKKNEFDKNQVAKELSKTDAGMARAAEDLISVLINKGIIAAEDLPKALMDKIEKREELRQKLSVY